MTNLRIHTPDGAVFDYHDSPMGSHELEVQNDWAIIKNGGISYQYDPGQWTRVEDIDSGHILATNPSS